MFSDILLTVDYDHTLTAPDTTIPKKNLDAIRYFIANGGAFTVNTGRSIPMSHSRLLPEVPVNVPLLLYNGSAAYDPTTGQLTQCVPLSLNPAEVIRDIQERFPDLNLEIQGVDAHYLCRHDAGWEAFCRNNQCRWAYIQPEDVPDPFLKFSLYGQFRENTMNSLYEATEEEMALFAQAISYIEKTYGDRVDVFRACARIADIHAKGCSKLRSARTLQQALGRRLLVCVGDGENDLSMLEGADYAFCPADGVVAGRFDTVCPCGEGAVAEVIYEKIPEILHK